MFGPEASGLSNKDLSYSNFILQIPTSPKFKSLNLSHSLTIVCYEIFRIINEKKINLNEYLFNYNANTFGKKITSIFKKLYNENITVRWLRISYTSNIRKQNLTNNELKIISDKMAHSLETNSRYNKINLSYS